MWHEEWEVIADLVDRGAAHSRYLLRRISSPAALAWTERTREMFHGLYAEYAFGALDDRCFAIEVARGA